MDVQNIFDETRDMTDDEQKAYINVLLKDSRIKYKLVEIKECNRGDIIEINNKALVLVDNGCYCDEGFIFTALPNSYIAVESGKADASYGYDNSGWENISENTLVKKIGHIELYYTEQDFGSNKSEGSITNANN